MTTNAKNLYTLAERIGPNLRVRRCVFGHGYPQCGCPWTLYYVEPIGGGLSQAMHLGYTIPQATLALRGILFGINYAKEN